MDLIKQRIANLTKLIETGEEIKRDALWRQYFETYHYFHGRVSALNEELSFLQRYMEEQK